MIAHLFIGCAGWAIPKPHAALFPAAGSHLERYSRRFAAVEINSSFYRPHRPATYQRWAQAVPRGFVFAVKAPRRITHELRLAAAEPALDAFLGEVAGLGAALGPLLFQLPPRLAFEADLARAFFAALRQRFAGAAVCEPRHPGWFTPRAEALLADWRIGRVAADPPPAAAAAEPGGWNGIRYFRLHGAPDMYRSEYDPSWLASLAARLSQPAASEPPTWCIFDNTALGAATLNAIALQTLLGDPWPGQVRADNA